MIDPPELLLSGCSNHWQMLVMTLLSCVSRMMILLLHFTETKHWLTLDTGWCAAVGLLLAPALHLWRHKVNITPQSDTKYSQRNIIWLQPTRSYIRQELLWKVTSPATPGSWPLGPLTCAQARLDINIDVGARTLDQLVSGHSRSGWDTDWDSLGCHHRNTNVALVCSYFHPTIINWHFTWYTRGQIKQHIRKYCGLE